MNEARLAAGVEVSALFARARDAGGFGTVLRRGDDQRGSILVVLMERGTPRFLLQRLLQRDGTYAWDSRESGDPAALDHSLQRARERDADLWLIELDIPSTERFIAEMT